MRNTIRFCSITAKNFIAIAAPARQGTESYFANAGSVVYVCAATAGMRIPRAPICAPKGLSNSIVPRMCVVARYLSDPSVNA